MIIYLEILKTSNTLVLRNFNKHVTHQFPMNAKKVMIVEDNALLAVVEERLVKKLGFEVVGKAISGEETIQKFNSLNPEILLMDIQLSGTLDGIETAKRIKETRSDVQVIFLSGNRNDELLERAKEVNYIDYLLKPVSANGLLEPLQKAAKYASSASQPAA